MIAFPCVSHVSIDEWPKCDLDSIPYYLKMFTFFQKQRHHQALDYVSQELFIWFQCDHVLCGRNGHPE